MAISPRQQQLVLAAILGGVVAFALVVAVVLAQTGHGLADPPVPVLDLVSLAAGASLAAVALWLRQQLRNAPADAAPDEAAMRQFQALLVPVAVLEGGMMLGLVTWLLNGKPLPGAAVAGALFLLALWVMRSRPH